MARVHPQDNVDVVQAARRTARYDCEFVLDEVEPADLSPIALSYSSKESGEKAIADALAKGPDAPLSRLLAAVVEVQKVTARLDFAVDDYDRPVVRGEAVAEILMPCQRCLEDVPLTLRAPLHSLIWLGSDLPSMVAQELALGEADLIVSPTAAVSFAALVEDDLLLALPERVCQQDDCPRAPVLSYPVPGSDLANSDTHAQRLESGQGEQKILADDRQMPFAGLRDLLDKRSDS